MARTKAEVRAFLDSLVGTIVPHPGYPDLNGQCVTLTKALMEFLGVPNPYAARGDAINAGDTYIRQGLGTEGKGWLTIVVNRDMGYIGGVHYGHIWVDLQGEANYESNGARALYTTKNTRPFSQGQQFVNFDKWIKENNMSSQVPADETTIKLEYNNGLFRDALPNEVQGLLGQTVEAVQRTIGGAPEHSDLLGKNALGTQARKLLGNDVSPGNMEAKMIAKYGNTSGNCTPDERAYLDALKKITK